MKQKIILSIAILSLLSLATFVSAAMMAELDSVGRPTYDVRIEVTKGWNLVSGFSDVKNIHSNSEVKAEDIKAVWYYSPVKNIYLNMYPNRNWDEFQDDVNYYGEDDYIMISSMWLYSEKTGILQYKTGRFPSELKYNKMIKGWNFVSLTNLMIDKSLEDIKGNCDITKAYVFNAAENEKEWHNVGMDDDIPREAIGMGMVVKVSSDCNLGDVSSSIPPSIPN